VRLLKPTREAITAAARAIRAGKLVVVPTETVYGLAADALDADAVARIFAAKRRPPENPLIVHVSSVAHAKTLVLDWPEHAETLAQKFWPGPLTLVLPKAAQVPAITTGGLNTVAIRFPANDICTRLIDACARPLAAPSANKFMGLSPTRVEHLDEGLLNHVEYVLDGGPCVVGIESTVLDLTGSPMLLRPGAITKQHLEAALGQPVRISSPEGAGERRSPGMYARHYAPRTQVHIVEKPTSRVALVFDHATADQIRMPDDATSYGAWLYAALHLLDQLGASKIEIEAPPHGHDWDAVWDRLHKMQST